MVWIIALAALFGCSEPEPSRGLSFGETRSSNACSVDTPGPELEYAYVVDQARNRVHVINPRTCSVVRAIEVNEGPVAANATASGRWVLVAHRDGSLLVIDDDAKRIHRTLDLGFVPVDMRFGGGRRLLWVLGAERTAIFDTVTQEVVASVEVGTAPLAMTRSEPATAVLGGAEGLELRQEADAAVLRTVPLGGPVQAVGYAEGTDAIYACTDQPSVAWMEVSGEGAWAPQELALPQPCVDVTFEDCSTHGVALLADRRTAVLLDGEGPRVVGTVDVGAGAEDISFLTGTAAIHSPGAATLQLARFTEADGGPMRTVAVGEPRATPPLETRPSTDGRHVYLLDAERGQVHIVDTADGTVRGTVDVGGQLVDLIAAGPAGGSCC